MPPFFAERVIRHMDLTSLGTRDEVERASIKALLADVAASPVKPFAFCTWPEFVPLVVEANEQFGMTIVPCTVVNFPRGADTLANIYQETKVALALGAKEIDCVIDYQGVRDGAISAVVQELKACRGAIHAGNDPAVKMKAILETSALLPDPNNRSDEAKLLMAAHAALSNDADFLKTSTGKYPNGGATPDAVRALLRAIETHDNNAGVKVSGGLRKVEDAQVYFGIVDRHYGLFGQVGPDLLRLGASRALFDDAASLMDRPQNRTVFSANPSASDLNY